HGMTAYRDATFSEYCWPVTPSRLSLLCALLIGGMAAGCDRHAVPDPTPPQVEVETPSGTIGKSRADATRTDGISILRDVRTGTHPGMDRVTFEFDGDGLPAWEIEYVDQQLRDCGSGDVVPVAGDAWLEIRFVGAQAHTDEGEPTSGPRRRAVDQPVMRELVRTCDFEGHVTWVVGGRSL